MSCVVWAHLQGLGTEDVLMQGGDKDFREMVDLLFCFLTTPLHAAGHALQRLRQLLLRSRPLGVGGPVLLQFVQILWKHRGHMSK